MLVKIFTIKFLTSDPYPYLLFNLELEKIQAFAIPNI